MTKDELGDMLHKHPHLMVCFTKEACVDKKGLKAS